MDIVVSNVSQPHAIASSHYLPSLPLPVGLNKLLHYDVEIVPRLYAASLLFHKYTMRSTQSPRALHLQAYNRPLLCMAVLTS